MRPAFPSAAPHLRFAGLSGVKRIVPSGPTHSVSLFEQLFDARVPALNAYPPYPRGRLHVRSAAVTSTHEGPGVPAQGGWFFE
jgi:hypothetical protein